MPRGTLPITQAKSSCFRCAAGQRGRVPWRKRAAAQKTSEVHRGHDNQRLEQRIVDESTGHGQRLVQPEEQSHTHGRKSLKSIDGNDADEDSEEHGSGSVAGVELFLQQEGCELPRAGPECMDHGAASSRIRSRVRLRIRLTPPTTRRSPRSRRPPTPCR